MHKEFTIIGKAPETIRNKTSLKNRVLTILKIRHRILEYILVEDNYH